MEFDATGFGMCDDLWKEVINPLPKPEHQKRSFLTFSKTNEFKFQSINLMQPKDNFR